MRPPPASSSSPTMRKSWNGVIEPTVRSSSPYFESLKWNPPSRPTIARRDDLLDVGVGQVMAEVDQALGPVAGALGQQQRRAPVVVHRRVERRLVGLVLGVHRPVAGQVGVDLAQTGEHSLELAPGWPGPGGSCRRPATRSGPATPARRPGRPRVVVLDRRLAAPSSTLARLPNLYDTAPSRVVEGLSWNVLEFMASKAMPRSSAWRRSAAAPAPEPGRPTARGG